MAVAVPAGSRITEPPPRAFPSLPPVFGLRTTPMHQGGPCAREIERRKGAKSSVDLTDEAVPTGRGQPGGRDRRPGGREQDTHPTAAMMRSSRVALMADGPAWRIFSRDDLSTAIGSAVTFRQPLTRASTGSGRWSERHAVRAVGQIGDCAPEVDGGYTVMIIWRAALSSAASRSRPVGVSLKRSVGLANRSNPAPAFAVPARSQSVSDARQKKHHALWR
jgi:hypothetical protein